MVGNSPDQNERENLGQALWWHQLQRYQETADQTTEAGLPQSHGAYTVQPDQSQDLGRPNHPTQAVTVPPHGPSSAGYSQNPPEPRSTPVINPAEVYWQPPGQAGPPTIQPALPASSAYIPTYGAAYNNFHPPLPAESSFTPQPDTLSPSDLFHSYSPPPITAPSPFPGAVNFTSTTPFLPATATFSCTCPRCLANETNNLIPQPREYSADMAPRQARQANPRVPFSQPDRTDLVPVGMQATAKQEGGYPPMPWTETECFRKVTSHGRQIIPRIVKAGLTNLAIPEHNYWVVYRRNYISVECSYALEPVIPDEPLYVHLDNRKAVVQALGIGLRAVVDKPDGKSIELVQHTPKRDKGPQYTLRIEKLSPAPTEHSNLGRASGPIPCPDLPLQSEPPQLSGNHLQPPDPAQTCHTFERLQFKQATANNGRRRAAQQYYHLILTLYADIREPGQRSPQWEALARRISEPMIVRGRSPGHYTGPGAGNGGNSNAGGKGSSGGAGASGQASARAPGGSAAQMGSHDPSYLFPGASSFENVGPHYHDPGQSYTTPSNPPYQQQQQQHHHHIDFFPPALATRVPSVTPGQSGTPAQSVTPGPSGAPGSPTILGDEGNFISGAPTSDQLFGPDYGYATGPGLDLSSTQTMEAQTTPRTTFAIPSNPRQETGMANLHGGELSPFGVAHYEQPAPQPPVSHSLQPRLRVRPQPAPQPIDPLQLQLQQRAHGQARQRQEARGGQRDHSQSNSNYRHRL